MKCTRCGKEMTIKPVQSGTDESGEPVFTRYAFCYDCKIKVNLDKQKERDTQKKATAEDVVETKTKRKKNPPNQKKKDTTNTPEQKTRGFKLEIELFADFLPESITKKEAIERITEALRQFNEYSGATTGRT